MKVYVVRHCTTECNEKGIYCGSTDIPLSDVGLSEAKRLSDITKRYDFDLVLSSPLLRAQQTAKAIVGTRNIPIIYENMLVERDFGVFEGKSVDLIDGKVCRYSFATKYPNGESNLHVASRIYRFLDELQEKYFGKNLFIVSHGSVCRIIRTYFKDMTDDEFYSYSHRNGIIEEYEF